MISMILGCCTRSRNVVVCAKRNIYGYALENVGVLFEHELVFIHMIVFHFIDGSFALFIDARVKCQECRIFICLPNHFVLIF